jgi:hypothetical protein
MTSGTISVTAEWARRGKTPDDSEYRLLACSDGKLSSQNFEDAIGRYLPGTLETLPQVSVSYLARADQPGGSYLALAIHEFAEGGQFDVAGRAVAFIRYFCVPYEQLAADAVSYRAMYEAFRTLPLPSVSGPPEQVTITPIPARVPVDDYQAQQVAALLLTDCPVCVLGAERTSVADRLWFIDTVMSLLPYGMRSRMSASTWTSSSYQTHRFRLFFTDAPRAAEGRDHVVIWGRPERTAIAPDLGYAYEYLAWLEDKIQQPVLRLSELSDEFGFKSKQVLQMLELIGIAGSQPELDYSADRQDLLHPTRTPPRGSKSYAETLLLDCVRLIREANLRELKSNIAALRNYAASAPRNDDRARYQHIIFRNQFLRPGQPVGRLEGRFYDALLRLAFGMPLSYADYCRVEDCLGNASGQVPHHTLLEAIEHGGIVDARVNAIVLKHLGEKKLNDWFRSRPVDVGQLITWLAGDWGRPHHAKFVCDVTVEYLREMRGQYEPRALLVTLRQHGYLAQVLHLRHPDLPQYQIYVLSEFLLAATGGVRLNMRAVADVMTGTGTPPTPALLAAVLLLLADPADAKRAMDMYLTGLFRFMSLDAHTRAVLEQFTPGSIETPDRLAIERGLQPEPQHHQMPPPRDGRSLPSASPPERPLDYMRDLKQVPEPKKRRLRLPPLVQKYERPKPGPDQY